VVDAFAVENGFRWVGAAGGGVFGLGFAFSLGLALIVVLVVGGGEDAAAAGVDACG
jgi:hypothetical protein